MAEPAPAQRDPVEPGPPEPGPAEPGPAEPGPAEPGPAEPGPAEAVRRAAITVAALAQDGLTFATDPYDVDRYRKLADLAADLVATVAGRPAEQLRLELGAADGGYRTPKVDVRGALVDEQERVLLTRERSDGRWSLPGGWADPGDTPRQAVVREVREETGYGAEVVELVAVLDRDAQGMVPRLAVSVYKMFFLCRATGQVDPPQDLETLEIGWFGLHELPELSQGRVTRPQIERVLAHRSSPGTPTEVD